MLMTPANLFQDTWPWPSANFTSAAQTTNVEIGVLARDTGSLLGSAHRWRGLAARRLFRRMNR
jgi:hypothetical protein